MQKMKNTILHGLLAAVTGTLLFGCAVIRAKAGEIAGSEVYFTHAHANACYETVSLSCENKHHSTHSCEYGVYHCSNCGGMTTHYIVADNYSCPVQGVTWQKNAYTGCNTCGTRHSEWSSDAPGNHTYTEQRQKCGLTAGENTAGVRITADDGWTNSGVTLKANANIVKKDVINGSITYSWGGDSLYVTENGTYSVEAVNGAGNTVSATIQIQSIDKIPPVINSVAGDTAGMSQNSITVTVHAGDGESGLADAAYSMDGGATWSGSSAFQVREGESVSLVVRDRAGNTSSKTIRRSDFPYPPAPPPIKQPVEQSGGVSGTVQSASAAGDSTGNDSGKGSVETANSGEVRAEGERAAAEKKKEEKAAARDSGKAGKTEKTDAESSNSGKESSSKESGSKESGSKENAVPKPANTEKSEVRAENSIGRYTDTKTGRAADSFRVSRMEKPDAAQKKGRIFTYSEGVSKEEQAVKAALSLRDKAQSFLQENRFFLIIMIVLLVFGFWAVRFFWLHSVLLYSYNGGDEYRKLGLLYLKKGKEEFELFLPDYLLEEAPTPRYRLLIKEKLVKRCKKKNLIVRSEEHKLRHPMEECVDFVL